MIEYTNITMTNTPCKTLRKLVGVDIFSGITYIGTTDSYTYDSNFMANVFINDVSYTTDVSYTQITFDIQSTGTTNTTGITYSGTTSIGLEGDISGSTTYTTGHTHTSFLKYSGNTYNWKVYVPLEISAGQYINDNMGLILNDIIRKEAEWVIAPKTKWVTNPGGELVEVPVQKSEIVKPTIPDYEELLRDDFNDISAIKRLLVKLMGDTYLNPNITQQDIDDLAVIQTGYQVNTYYSSGSTFSFEGKLYEVIQSHTSQADWYPPTTPALYKIKTPAGTIAEWVQPLGTQDAYNIGDKVLHNGFTWESTVGSNIWEPGVYGWVQI